MLSIIAELCRACSQEKNQNKKIALKERMATLKHQLMMESLLEAQLAFDDEDCDEFFDLKAFFTEIELACFNCDGNAEEVCEMIRDHLLEISKERMAADEAEMDAAAVKDGPAKVVSIKSLSERKKKS